jgi:di/tricarboxylate transporter
MADVMLPADSRLVGRILVAMQLRSQYDLTAIRLRRGATAHAPERPRKERLQPGDTLLLVGAWKAIRQLRGGRDLVALNRPKESDEVLPAAKQAPFAIIVALAASSAFMTPIAPPNAMVATPDNDRFGDYVRVGLPFVVVMTVSVARVPWLFPSD